MKMVREMKHTTKATVKDWIDQDNVDIPKERLSSCTTEREVKGIGKLYILFVRSHDTLEGKKST